MNQYSSQIEINVMPDKGMFGTTDASVIRKTIKWIKLLGMNG